MAKVSSKVAKEQTLPVPQPQSSGLVARMAEKFGVQPADFYGAVLSQCFRGNEAKVTKAELLAFMVVADKYELNPFLGQIFAIPSARGIVPYVGVDGWVTLAQRSGRLDGFEFEDIADEKGKLLACQCTMFVKGFERAVRVIEYLDECYRDTKPWQQMPRRMLRHKAFIQAARLAFGIVGVFDEDEAERIAGIAPEPRARLTSVARPSMPASTVDVPMPEAEEPEFSAEESQAVDQATEPMADPQDKSAVDRTGLFK